MFNKYLILSVLTLCGLSVPASAQRIGFQFGNKGLYISASADLGHEYRQHGDSYRRPRAWNRSKSRHRNRRGHRSQGRVWVRGHYERVYVQASYRWVDDCGYRRRVLVRGGHYQELWVPGYYRHR